MLRAVVIKHVELSDKVVRNIIQVIITTRGASERHIDGRCQDLDVGVLGSDRIVELLESIGLVRAETAVEVVLVADLDVADGPRLGMSILGSQSTILCVDGSGEELQLVQCVLDVEVELGLWDEIPVQSKSSPYPENWFQSVKAYRMVVGVTHWAPC